MNWIGLGFIILLLIVLTAVMIMLIIGLNEVIFALGELTNKMIDLSCDIAAIRARNTILGSQIDRLTKELNDVTIEKQN